MEARGIKGWAVMAIRPGWKKLKFVWPSGIPHRFSIFPTRRDAVKVRDQMNADGYNELAINGNEDKRVEVTWTVQPVWMETMGSEA